MLCRRATIAAILLVLILPAAARAATISGFVRGAQDGEALPYANVQFKGTAYGAVTNQAGYYVIVGLPAGAYDIVFSYIGHLTEARSIVVEPDQELTLTIELKQQDVQMEAVEVTAGHEELMIEPSKLTMHTRELQTVPLVVEGDLLRAVQTMPGVASLSDFSAGLYVRGGSPDQNLILLDDIDVYNPSHLFGFFSTFNVDAVKTVDLQKSGFPARYGGRLSSLLDVHNRDGNRKEYEGVVRSSIIASSATVEGPWSHGSWMASGRHTYIEPLASAMDIDLPYKFYDVHGKFNYDPRSSDRASLSYYTGKDRLDWETQGLDVLLDWGNETWSAQWTHLFSTRLFSHFVLGRSSFDSRADFAFRDFAFRTKNRIDDLSFKGDLSYSPVAEHMIEFGAESKVLEFSFRREIGEEDKLSFRYDGVYGALYGQDNWKLSPVLQVQPGLRLDYYSKGEYFRVGPRLAIRRALTERISAHASYGRYSQFLNLVAQEGASFADMWFPVDRTLKPGGADHYILGVAFGPYDRFDLSIDGYWKPYRNVVAFSEEFTRSLVTPDATVGELFDSGEGDAYGADLFIKNRYGRFEGWLGYSWGVTKRKIGGYNFGRTYHPDYDRRHQLVCVQDCALGGRWKLNLSGRFGSGQPVTLAAGRYTVRDVNGREYDVILEGEKNAHRLPYYLRIDFGLFYQRKYKWGSLEPNLQVINVLNRDNVYIRNYDLTTNPATFDDISQLPFLPTIGVTVNF